MLEKEKITLNRSPFFYVGDKYKLLPQIKENFPKNFDRFIEPFCGGGSVFLNVSAKKYILNDIDTYIIKLHKFLVLSSKNTLNFWNDLHNCIEKYNLSATFIGKNVPQELKKEYIKTYSLLPGILSVPIFAAVPLGMFLNEKKNIKVANKFI